MLCVASGPIKTWGGLSFLSGGLVRILWPLNQLNPVTDRIDHEAENDAAFPERAGLSLHRSTGGLDRGDCRSHILHQKNHVRYRVLHVVRLAVKKYHLRVLVRLGGFHRGAEVHEDLSASRI